jgi:membrane-bound metal-dependent hydrolase YbcI (DUF457 family)
LSGSGISHVFGAPAAEDGGLGLLARAFSRRDISLLLIAVVAVLDLVVPWHHFDFIPRALVDEPCHLAMAGIALGAITRLRGAPPGQQFGWAMLSASVLIDIDHLPLEFGSSAMTTGTPRPYTHALWVVVVLAAAAGAAIYWSQYTNTATAMATAGTLAGATLGVSAHFLRDVATAPMSLWWPVSHTAVEVPYGWYVGALVIIVAIPPRRHHKHDSQTARYRQAAALFRNQAP